MKVTHLDVGKDDLAGVLEIEEQSFTHPWTLTDFELLVRDERSINVGIWMQEELAGYAMALAEGDGDLHLVSLAVIPVQRNKGVGSELMSAMLSRAQSRACRYCHLEVRVSNSSACALYEKFGFEITGTKCRFYTQPVEDAWIMRRHLDDGVPQQLPPSPATRRKSWPKSF